MSANAGPSRECRPSVRMTRKDRWQGYCSCGWSGTPTLDYSLADREAAAHHAEAMGYDAPTTKDSES